ncbi:hypothetical protein GQ53DRAFT_642912 [Thozetella sp. PMI_491]|nr:hypothetical protein GQ53DRAFT_642912 [Thozetella sp. PMI_491]
MRRSFTVFLLINFAILAYALASVWTLLTLLVVDGSADGISFAETYETDTGSDPPRQVEVIPRIIHQTYKDDVSLPAHWEAARQTCLELHPPEEGWEYKLWTDKTSRDFVAAEYPWILDTFDGYKYPIQRADAIRYLVLSHYGGIYIDMDDGCQRKLDPLLAYPAWLRRTVPTGISNDVMGSVPRHPFFVKAVDALPRYNRNWLLPYITVMASTGPLFLSLIWRHYDDEIKGEEAQRVRILTIDQYKGNETSFFEPCSGSSWHEGDAKLVFWMRDHWVLLVVVGFFVAYLVFLRAWRVHKRLSRRCRETVVGLLKEEDLV